MKKVFAALAVVLLVTGCSACSRVPPGNVGVIVNNLGSSKGVDTEEADVGYIWVGFWRSLYLFPTFAQNYVWTRSGKEGSSDDESITFQTAEGLVVDADVGITYAVEKSKAQLLFQKYRRGIDEITNIYLRNMVRDAIVTDGSKLPVEAVYGKGKGDLMKAVEAQVRSEVEPIGIKIERIYWIGNIRLPDAVVTALNAKIQATQMAQQRENEVAQATAEAQKKVEEAKGEAQSVTVKAQAQAQANQIIAASLTPELVQYKALEVWDGRLPAVTAGAVPFIDVTRALTATPPPRKAAPPPAPPTP